MRKLLDLATAFIATHAHANDMNFHRAPIASVIEAMSTELKTRFEIETELCGTLSLKFPADPTPSELKAGFYAALASQALAVVPGGKGYRIKSARNASRDSDEVPRCVPFNENHVTQVVRFARPISTNELKVLLRLTTRDGDIAEVQSEHSIVITDDVGAVEKIVGLAHQTLPVSE